MGTAGGTGHDAVHHCLVVAEQPDAERGPALPPYVRRQHDRV